MQEVTEILQKIALLPGAVVDRNFLQGHDVVREQLELRGGNYSEQFVQEFVSEVKACIATMNLEVSPYGIPEDYKYFLEYCGGLSIEDEADYYFSTYGIGPLVEKKYGSINSDDAAPDFCWPRGLIQVGHLNFRSGKLKYHDFYFYHDLAGCVQQNCVFRVGPCGLSHVSPQTVIEDLQFHKDKWKRMSASFTEWLALVDESKGAFGYGG